MSDARTLPPLLPTSRLLRVYGWLLALGPVVNLLFALEPSVTGRAPEQAIGGFITIPLLIATLLLAPVLAVRALASPLLAGNQKLICAALSFAAFPMFLLVQGIWTWVGSHSVVQSPVLVVLAAVAMVWMGVVWWARVMVARKASNPSPGPHSE